MLQTFGISIGIGEVAASPYWLCSVISAIRSASSPLVGLDTVQALESLEEMVSVWFMRMAALEVQKSSNKDLKLTREGRAPKVAQSASGCSPSSDHRR